MELVLERVWKELTAHSDWNSGSGGYYGNDGCCEIGDYCDRQKRSPRSCLRGSRRLAAMDQ